MSDERYHVKARMKGDKRFVFFARDGYTRLRVHARQYDLETAKKFVEFINNHDETIETKIVPAYAVVIKKFSQSLNKAKQ
jgi:hypothetical protein